MEVNWIKKTPTHERAIEAKNEDYWLYVYDDGDKILLMDEADTPVAMTKKDIEILKEMYRVLQVELEKARR